MLTPEELEAIKQSIVPKWRDWEVAYRQWEASKKWGRYASKDFATEPVLPEYYTGYRMAVDMMEQIDIHASKYRYPDKLFICRAPNETDAEYIYRRQNYKNTTAPVFSDYLATVGRSNSDQNWSLETEDIALYEYLTKQLPKYKDIGGYLKNFITPLKAKDANGIIAIEPKNIPLIRDEEGNISLNGEGMAIISDEPVEPMPVYYSCRHIVAQELDEWYAVISYEKSEVQFNGKSVKMGLVVRIFDEANIYEFRQTGVFTDYQFTPVFVRYPHTYGQVPAAKLKGIVALIEDKIIYISHFSPAADLLDLVLLDESNLSAIKATSIYPYKVALGTPCTFERGGNRCNDGMLFNPSAVSGNYDGEGKQILGRDESCPNCLGSGLRPRMSPFGVLLINPGTQLNETGDGNINGDYLKFVSPPIDAPRFLQEQIDKNEYRSRKIIHLQAADTAVTGKEGINPTASLNNARATSAFIEPISDQTFEIMETMIGAINSMRFTDAKGFTLTKPQNFDITTPSDQLELISIFIKDGLPPGLTAYHIQKYIASISYTSSNLAKSFKLIMDQDLLICVSPDDINLRLTAGDIEPWRDTLHQSGFQLIKMLLEEDPFFFTQDYKIQADKFIQKAKDETVDKSLTDPGTAAAEQMRRIAETTA